ncbi:MAG: hypothetical protein K0S76_2081 [Herbinix sp.]|jgi:hypothetical protein|nr:hypothetical protein [Herbinix sp.]
MSRLKLYLYVLINLFGLAAYDFTGDSLKLHQDKMENNSQIKQISAMEALDVVKELYADNFEKIDWENTDGYYYKLPDAEYYLIYEGMEQEDNYLFHLYEFVLDEPETGIGHTYTYGWYTVNRNTGVVTDNTQ